MRGAAVSWFSSTQKCVTLSTSEAEYVAMADSIKEAIFMRHVWRFLLSLLSSAGLQCIKVFEGNEGARSLASNPVSNSNTKHIDSSQFYQRVH